MGEPTPVTDNYAQFIARLDTATEDLSHRSQSLSRSLAVLTLLRDQNLAGMEAWEQRRARTSKLLAEHSPGPEAESLGELLEVALRMEPMFRDRTERIGQRLELLRKRSDELTKSLVALEKSKAKLESSRMLAQERDNLSRAVATLAGTPEGPVGGPSDAGILDDLKKAREAIVLAEALLEVKGK